MALTTYVASFDSHASATQAVHALEAAGFSHDEVSLLGGDRSTATTTDDSEGGTGAGVGATVGTMLGGGAGLLAGIGALAIPGLGPIVAAGWLVAAITGAGAGAAAGGLLGGLVGSGVSESDAHLHAEVVRRGGTLVTVRADESRMAQARAILDRHTPVDMAAREADYRASGWTGYNDDAIIPATPDGTPGNPRGTALSRGVDDVAGTNISGARPMNEMGASRSGQVSPRADDDGKIIPRQPDGAPGNPKGTELSRGVDEALGTNISGAHPENNTRR